MYLRAIVGAVILIIATGCGGAKSGGASSADDADKPAGGDGNQSAQQLSAGAAVCVENVVGIRYEIEDVLEELDLKPVRDCYDADFQIAEEGGPGDFVMRYRKVGESDWQSCKSSSQDRTEFNRECLGAALGSLGDGSGDATAN